MKQDQQSQTVGRECETPFAVNGGLEIDRSKSSASPHGRRSDESRPRESVWDLRNPNGSESREKAADHKAKNRIRRKNGAICDFERHGAEDWWNSPEEIQGGGGPGNDETGEVEWRDRANNMPTVLEEFGFLIIPGSIKRETISKKVANG